ncbi:MAG: TolC family protein [bacterium]
MIKKLVLNVIIILFLNLCFTQKSFSEEIILDLSEKQVPVTFEQSLKTALENNFSVKITTSQKERDKWLYYNSISDFLPDVSFNYIHSRLGGIFLIESAFPVKLSETNVDTGFVAQWEGFTGFRRYFDLKASQYVYDSSKKRLDLTKEQVLLLVARQYYTLLQDKLNTQILTKALEQTQAQLNINQQRFNAEVGTKFDVLRAEAEVASSKQNLIAAYNRLKLSQAQLANTLGINVLTPLIPSEETVVAKNLFKDSFDLNKIVETALENKPDLAIAKLNVAATRAKKNSTYSIYLPTAAVRTTVNGTGQEISNLNQNQSVSLLVFWQGGENLGFEGFTNAKAANAQLKEAKLKFIDTARNIEQSVLNSYYDTLTSKELMQASLKEVESAEESLRLSIVRLEAGVGIYTDVIAAQLTETRARIRHLNDIINYNTSQAQLLFEMGVISTDNLLEGYEIKK